MQPKLDAWTIVINGLWNTRIFSPEWVSERLFQTKNLQCEFLIQNGIIQLRYQSDGIIFVPNENRITIGATNTAPSFLSSMERVGIQLCELLPHTPLSGLGINFGFTIDDQPDSLTALFTLADDSSLSDLGCSISRTEIRRCLLFRGHTINTTSVLTNDTTEIHLNFHTEVITGTQVVDKLGGQVQSSLEMGYRILEDAYGLKLDASGEDNVTRV